MWETLNMLELKQDMTLQSVLRTIYFSSAATPLWRGSSLWPMKQVSFQFLLIHISTSYDLLSLSDYLLAQKITMLDWLGNY